MNLNIIDIISRPLSSGRRQACTSAEAKSRCIRGLGWRCASRPRTVLRHTGYVYVCTYAYTYIYIYIYAYAHVCEQTLLWCKPWPCNPVRKTAFQPRICLCSQGVLFSGGVFFSQTPIGHGHPDGSSKFDPIAQHAISPLTHVASSLLSP